MGPNVFLFKYQSNDISEFKRYVENSRLLFDQVQRKQMKMHTEVITIDFFCQIVFLKCEFDNELSAIAYIANNFYDERKSLSSFEKLYTKIYELMISVHLKILPGMRRQEYAKIIRLLLNKVCFSRLFKEILGSTCMNTLVFIKYPLRLASEIFYSPSKSVCVSVYFT